MTEANYKDTQEARANLFSADACIWTLDTVNALENLYPVFRDKAGRFLSQFATAHFNIDDVIPYQADTKLRLFNMEAVS